MKRGKGSLLFWLYPGCEPHLVIIIIGKFDQNYFELQSYVDVDDMKLCPDMDYMIILC